MTDELMIKGYRLPRPTFGLGWWTVGTNNFVGVSALLLLAICAGKYLFFNKGNNNMVKIDPTSTVECVQSKAFETAAPTTPITVSGNVGIDPSATVQIAPNQQVAAVPSGDFKAVPQGDFNAVGKGEIECAPSKSAHLKVSNSDNIKVPLVGEFGTAVEAFAEATNAFKDATEKIGQVTKYQAEILDKTLQSEQRAIEFAENQSKITGASINIPPTTDIPADDIDK